MKKIIFSIICFFAMCNAVSASCTYTRTSELKKIASNVNVSYDYVIKNDKAYFNVTFTNLTSDIYLYDAFNNKKYTSNGEITIKNVEGGLGYSYFIKSNDKSCLDDVLVTKYVNLPKYNKYYGDELCEGIEEYALCQKWGKFEVSSYTEYINTLKKYRNNKLTKEETNEEVTEESFLDVILNFMFKYYYVILIFIIVLNLTIIFTRVKKDKKYF